MARVKDRLIFETKKMDAVAQRKSNKEQKLRSKESQSNKVAEKAKRKKDHFKQLDDWAQSAATNRGRGNERDNEGGMLRSMSSGGVPAEKSKKRQLADKKYGFGGKRGRFKQNDPKELNDMSRFNPRGNFGGIGTKKTFQKDGAGSNRKGKRARDASRGRS
jgi:rRNA-processing protein EBP2